MRVKKEKDSVSNALNFLTPARIDLIPKIEYIKNKKNNVNADFFVNMYLEHIKAFNHFNENHKRTKEDFLRDFDNLIKSIDKKGFDKKQGIVPVTENNVAIDGAHRLASCISLGKKVHIKKRQGKGPNYNYQYFKKRGIDEQILEEMIFKYLKFKKKNLYMCIFWGSSLGKIDEKEISRELEKEGIQVVYSKKVGLTEQGKKNLIIACYENEPWMSDKGKNFSGALRKVAPCFKKSNKILFYLLESEDKEKIILFKKKIRDKLQMGNHSIHSSDSHEETENLCSLLLNKNSRFFLNHGEYKLLPDYLEKIDSDNKEHFAITSSYVMEMFGLRKAEDIDIIGENKLGGVFNTHNYYFKPEERSDFVYNPKNFFRFKGLKFLTLDKISKFKKQRGEKKDKQDILLIEKFLNSNRKFELKEKLFLVQMKGVSLVLKLIKKIPQDKRNKLKQNKPIMAVYRKLFA